MNGGREKNIYTFQSAIKGKSNATTLLTELEEYV